MTALEVAITIGIGGILIFGSAGWNANRNDAPKLAMKCYKLAGVSALIGISIYLCDKMLQQ